MEKRSTPKDAVRLAVPSTTERSLREFSSPQRAFFLCFRPKLPVKAEKTPRFLKKTPRYLEHIPKVRTFASQLRTRALSSAGSERLPYKQRVGGSNPSAPTSPVRRLHLFWNLRALSSAGSERLPYKQRVGGSNPSAPTLIFPFQKTPIPNRALSSAGSERLPYKQRVGGSNPSAPTSQEATQKSRFFFLSLPGLTPNYAVACAMHVNERE